MRGIRRKLKAVALYPKVLGTILAALIPAYLLCLFLNDYGVGIVRNNINESMQSNVNFYNRSFETEIFRLERLKREFLVDDDLLKVGKRAAALSDYELTASLLRVQNKAALLKGSSVYVEDVKIYFPSIGRTLYSNYYGDAMADDEVRVLQKDVNQLESPFIYWKGKILMSEVFPQAWNMGSSPAFALELELSKSGIVEMLRQMGSQAGGGAIFIQPEQGWVVAAPENEQMAFNFMRKMQEDSLKLVSGTKPTIVEGRKYWIASEASPTLGLTLVHFVPESSIIGPLKTLRRWLWFISCLSVVLIFFVSWLIFRYVHKPLRQLVLAFRKIEEGNLKVKIYHKYGDEFRYVYDRFNAMTEQLQILIHEVYDQKFRSQRSELKLLQSQINPHFLYNSYFVLHRMIEQGDTDHALVMSEHLGEYFQFITRSAKDEVMLAEEVGHSIAFLRIQSLRFMSRIDTRWESLPQGYERIQVPRLILQPILENAYHHGLDQKVAGGVIRMSFTSEPNIFLIVIEDNGEHLTDECLTNIQIRLDHSDEGAETKGMVNVHRRIVLKFGPSYGLRAVRSGLGGLRVEIRLPAEER